MRNEKVKQKQKRTFKALNLFFHFLFLSLYFLIQRRLKAESASSFDK